MKHAISNWQEIAANLEGRFLFLCLDYDGTLTRIVRNPDQAKLSSTSKKILQALSKSDQMRLVVISGRSLPDLKKRIGLKGLIYAGNHGFEFEGPKIHFVHPQAQALIQLMKRVAETLERDFKGYPGTIVENKGLSLSFHYRKLNPKRVDDVKSVFQTALDSYLRTSLLATTEGKKVWEVRPAVKWNKGTTLLWLLARLEAHLDRNVCPIYIGDDQTDEDVFRALKGRGISIKVRDTPAGGSEADYYVSSTREVIELLKRIYKLKSDVTESCCVHP